VDRSGSTDVSPRPAPVSSGPGLVPVTEVLEQLLSVARRAGAEVTIDVRQGLAIRGELRRDDEQLLLQLAVRTVREIGGRRRRTTPTLDVRLGHRALEVAAVDRAAVPDLVRVAVEDPAIDLVG
jgi:hypothetical protein